MMKTFLCFSLVLVTGCHGASVSQNALNTSSTTSFNLDDVLNAGNLFKQFKQQHSRAYSSSTAEQARFQIFKETLKSYFLHNLDSDKQTFTVGLNQYSDWTSTELKALRGYQPDGDINAPKITGASQQRLLVDEVKLQAKTSALPTSFDYTTRVVTGSNVPLIRAIKDQGACGGCYSFAFVTLLEAKYALQFKSTVALSEQQFIDCSKSNFGCNGGSFTGTFSYLRDNIFKVDSNTTYPYKHSSNKVCNFITSGCAVFPTLTYKQVTSYDVTTMQQALNDYGPLWFGMFVGNDSYKTIQTKFQGYKGGVFQMDSCPSNPTSINHAMVIVGYGVDSTSNLPYWKVRNSWGIYWGEQGYIRIRRGVNTCGIESTVFYIAKTA